MGSPDEIKPDDEFQYHKEPREREQARATRRISIECQKVVISWRRLHYETESESR